MTEPQKPDFAQEFYFKMRAAVTGRLSRDAKRIAEREARAASKPFEKGRDAVPAGALIDGLLTRFGWDNQIQEADLFNRWTELVGEANAAASTPEKLERGLLTVRCKSTAWATQLKLMKSQVLTTLQTAFPTLELIDIRFIGPDAPSWKKGQRSVPGRGPRDTYG
jgi:predicted nucleic acid-binding Zn ribbon protein